MQLITGFFCSPALSKPRYKRVDGGPGRICAHVATITLPLLTNLSTNLGEWNRKCSPQCALGVKGTGET